MVQPYPFNRDTAFFILIIRENAAFLQIKRIYDIFFSTVRPGAAARPSILIAGGGEVNSSTVAVIHWLGNLISLWAAARITGFASGRRLPCAALLGTAGALFLPGLGGLVLWPPVMARLAFGRLSPGGLGRAALAVMISGALLSGLCGLWTCRGTAPLPALAGGALLLAPAALLFTPLPQSRCRKVMIRRGNRKLLLGAMVDTGNRLTDPVSGLPVIVCPRGAFAALGLDSGSLRCLSVSTCTGRGIMPVCRPGEVRLRIGGRWQTCDAMIGAAPSACEGMQALVPAQLIQS